MFVRPLQFGRIVAIYPVHGELAAQKLGNERMQAVYRDEIEIIKAKMFPNQLNKIKELQIESSSYFPETPKATLLLDLEGKQERNRKLLHRIGINISLPNWVVSRLLRPDPIIQNEINRKLFYEADHTWQVDLSGSGHGTNWEKSPVQDVPWHGNVYA